MDEMYRVKYDHGATLSEPIVVAIGLYLTQYITYLLHIS